MIKKIAILGSTGSIGKKTLSIFSKNINNFKFELLTTNKNINLLKKQIKKFKVKNVIVTDKIQYLKIKQELKNKNINIFNNFSQFNRIFNNKIDYTMASIIGLSGLEPTLKIIKYTKKIAIANKESIICAWNLISKELKKNKTKFVPVDSEHFSTWQLLDQENQNNIKFIYLTASGGPFLNYNKKQLSKIVPKKAINHPNWSMGKKISVDSATMMNKVFEVIEAQRLFNTNYKNIKILVHPDSYLHSIVAFNNGITKFLVHDTSMKIPIFNSIYTNENAAIKTNKLNLKVINNLNLTLPNKKKFPHLKILNKLPKTISLFETVIISANDELVNQFLQDKIPYLKIYKILSKVINYNKFKKLKKSKPLNLKQIHSLHNYVRLITRRYCELY